MRDHRALVLCLVLGLTVVFAPLLAADSVVTAYVLVGQSSDAIPNGYSGYADVSYNGRYVAFYSEANNLVTGDTAWGDVFVYDMETKTCELVSVGINGIEANQASGEEWAVRGLSISDDGNLVAFNSWASNLVDGDTQFDSLDVFVRELSTQVTTRISVGLDGAEANGSSWSPIISGDGSRVVFISRAGNLDENDGNGAADVFLYDLDDEELQLVSQGLDGKAAAADVGGLTTMGGLDISADGRYVVFASHSSDLIEDDTNDSTDVFLWDTKRNVMSRVSVSSDGRQGNDDSGESLPDGGGVAISDDGRYIAFVSWASNLVSGDTNQHPDVFLHDTVSGITERVSVSSEGSQAQWSGEEPQAYQQLPSVDISGDGRYVVFQSAATNLDSIVSVSGWGVYIHDSLTGVTRRIADTLVGESSAAQDGVSAVALSGDASILVFGSNSANILPAGASSFSDVYAARLDLVALSMGQVDIVPTVTLVPTAPVVVPTLPVEPTPQATQQVVATPTPIEGFTATPVLVTPTPEAADETGRLGGTWFSRIVTQIQGVFRAFLDWLVSLSKG